MRNAPVSYMSKPAPGLLLAAALLISGCGSVHDDFADARGFEGSQAVGVAAARPGVTAAGKNRYLAFQASRRATNGFGFYRLSHDLWAPFRVEASGGLFDARRAAAADQAIVCVELDARATNPLQFYGICAQSTNGGLNAYAYAHTSASALGSQFYTNATQVDSEGYIPLIGEITRGADVATAAEAASAKIDAATGCS